MGCVDGEESERNGHLKTWPAFATISLSRLIRFDKLKCHRATPFTKHKRTHTVSYANGYCHRMMRSDSIRIIEFNTKIVHSGCPHSLSSLHARPIGEPVSLSIEISNIVVLDAIMSMLFEKYMPISNESSWNRVEIVLNYIARQSPDFDAEELMAHLFCEVGWDLHSAVTWISLWICFSLIPLSPWWSSSSPKK